MTDPFMERITQTRTDKGKKVSSIMVETRSQKSSEGQKAMLEVEVHLDPALDEDQRDMDRKGEETEG